MPLTGGQVLNALAILASEGFASLSKYSEYFLREKFLGSPEYTMQPVIDSIISEANRHRYSTFIDIGAGIGVITRAVSKHFDSCIAVEPSMARFAKLASSIARLPNCTAVNCALGDRNASSPIYYSQNDPGDITVFPRQDLNKGRVVEIETLDGVIKRSGRRGPFLIKIDVQGYETFVMRGAKETLKDTMFVTSEFWPWGLLTSGSSASAYVNLMKGSGFTLFSIWGKPLNLSGLGVLQLSGFSRRSVSVDIIFKRSSS